MVDTHKKDIFIFAMILEGDMYQDGLGTTEEDAENHRKAMFKAYGATEDMSQTELEKIQEQLDTDAKGFVEEYRKKIIDYLNG